jgi:hypothetical protein
MSFGSAKVGQWSFAPTVFWQAKRYLRLSWCPLSFYKLTMASGTVNREDRKEYHRNLYIF